MGRLGKNDIVSIEDLTTVDIERIFELADTFAVGLERGETLIAPTDSSWRRCFTSRPPEPA